MRNKLIAVMAVVVLAGVGFSTASASSPSQAPTATKGDTDPQKAAKYRAEPGDIVCTMDAPNCTQYVEFDNAFDTRTYTVLVAEGGTTLTVDTQDCCIERDHWGVFMNKFGGVRLGRQNPVAASCSTGRASGYSGATTLTGKWMSGRVVQVVLVHCSGVADFPAGFDVRFRSDANIQVRQRN